MVLNFSPVNPALSIADLLIFEDFTLFSKVFCKNRDLSKTSATLISSPCLSFLNLSIATKVVSRHVKCKRKKFGCFFFVHVFGVQCTTSHCTKGILKLFHHVRTKSNTKTNTSLFSTVVIILCTHFISDCITNRHYFNKRLQNARL